MSTAEVARDMDVLRRAVGDKKLTYLGFSYGTALGQYYANMFPDRVRSVVVDGVIDPISWVGTSKTQNTIQDDRMRSSDGAYKALIEILKRCDKAGDKYCEFSDGDPVANFEKMAASLRIKPVVVSDPEFGDFTITYADFVGTMLGALYGTYAGEAVTSLSAELWGYLYGTPAEKAGAKAALVKRVKQARAKPGRDFPYNNGFEGFAGVMCTDGLHPKDASSWPAAVVKSDKRAPYFGRAWSWGSAQCARNTWTVQGRGRLQGSVHQAHHRSGPGRRLLLGPGHQLRGGRLLGQAAAQQPPAVQHQLGPHRLRHVGLRDQRDRRVPAARHAARQGQGL